MAGSAETSASGSGAPKARGESAARRRIEDEHRRLGELLRSIPHSHEPVHLQASLAELRRLLAEHFDHEEEPAGLHELVADGAAHRLPNLQHLFEEHRQILATLDGLEAQVARLVEGPWQSLREGISGLAETLRRHEHEEESLVAEAFYSDLGRS